MILCRMKKNMCLWHIYCCRTFVNSSGWWCHNHLEKSWSESKLGWLSHSHILWKVIQFHCSKEPTRYLGIPHLYIYIYTLYFGKPPYTYIYTNQPNGSKAPTSDGWALLMNQCWWPAEDHQKSHEKLTQSLKFRSFPTKISGFCGARQLCERWFLLTPWIL